MDEAKEGGGGNLQRAAYIEAADVLQRAPAVRPQQPLYLNAKSRGLE